MTIPALDDARDFPTYDRGRQLWSVLEEVGVTVQGKTVVEFGAGFGSLSLAATRAGARRVIALDIERTRMRELSRRQGKDKGTSHPIVADVLHPPIRDSTADIVLLVGLLEYAGMSSLEQPVSTLQRKMLTTAHAILRNNGLLLLASKNRLWPRFAFRDPHTGDPLVNALPRGAADALTKFLHRKPYRHHIHSPAGWLTLLRVAGFKPVRLVLPIFSYQFPLHFATQSDPPRAAALRANIEAMPPRLRRLAVGKLWRSKATLTRLALSLNLPISHSVLVIATK